jgi:hypothetical protein
MADDDVEDFIRHLADALAEFDRQIRTFERLRERFERLQERVEGTTAKEAIVTLADMDRDLSELREKRARYAAGLERAKVDLRDQSDPSAGQW